MLSVTLLPRKILIVTDCLEAGTAHHSIGQSQDESVSRAIIAMFAIILWPRRMPLTSAVFNTKAWRRSSLGRPELGTR
jgi:hypothetical protein